MRKKRPTKKARLYLDAAASTPLSAAARKELLRLLPLYGNPGALHSEALDAKQELEQARGSIAETVGAHTDEIIFTASGTESNNLALQGVLRPLLLQYGEVHAVTSAIEHQSVLAPLKALEREGLYTTVLPVDSEGRVDQKALAEAINDQTALVSIQLVNSEVGTVQPLRELAKTVREARKKRADSALPLYFHTDASQAPLWLKVGVPQLGIDLMTLDGQKVLGPKGVGALYIKRGTQVEPVLWGGSQENGLRGGTQNAPLAGSFAVALAHAQRNVEKQAGKIAALRDVLFKEIQKLLPEAVQNGAASAHRIANNLHIAVPGIAGELLVVSLDAEGVAASTRSACNTEDDQPSHVLTALGVPRELAKSSLRLTLLPTATRADMVRVAKVFQKVAKRQQSMV